MSFAKATAAHPLASRRPWIAATRFVRLQIGGRIASKPRLVPFIDQARIYAQPGMAGANGNYYFGLHEYADMAFVLHFLRAADTFFDVGSNVGSYTLLASAVVGARTIAFEPVPETVSRLRANIEANRASGLVTVRQECVGAEPGQVRFSDSRDTMNRVEADGPLSVVRITLDGVAHEPPALIKIDTEGYDSKVLKGASRILAEHSPAILSEYLDAEAFNAIAEIGYSDFRYDPDRRMLTAGRASGNRLLLRDADRAFRRVSTAAWRKVPGYGRI